MFSTTNVLAHTHKESGNKNEDASKMNTMGIFYALCAHHVENLRIKTKQINRISNPSRFSLRLESKISLDFKTLIPRYQLFEPHLTSVSLVFVKFLISAASWTRILKDPTCHLEWSLRFELTGQEW